jgi:hypothetical protein
MEQQYYFMALNVRDAGDGGQKYSDDQTIVGQAFSVLQEVSDVSVLNEVEQITLGWTLPACYDSVMVVVIEGINPTDTFPTGTVNDYLSGISANYSASTSYLNGTDASDGKVVYAGTGESLVVSGLENDQNYRVLIYTEFNTVWTSGVVLNAYPGIPEVIFTQVRSAGDNSFILPDFVEFITLQTIDFSTAQYNFSNQSICSGGWFLQGSGTSVGETFFSSLGEEVPAGTYVRFQNWSGTNDTDADDGIVHISSGASNPSLDINTGSGGEQAILLRVPFRRQPIACFHPRVPMPINLP